MPTSPLDELEMPAHHPEDPVLVKGRPEPPPEAAAAPPPEPPVAETPQPSVAPSVETEHLPPDYDPIREKGMPGTYTPSATSVLFERRTRPGARSKPEPEPEHDDSGNRKRAEPRHALSAAWTWLALTGLALFLLVAFHYLSALSGSQERLDARLTGRQDKLEKRQKASEEEQTELAARQGTVEGEFGRLQADVDTKTGGIRTAVQRLQGTVNSLGAETRGVKTRMGAIEMRLDRDERQRQAQAPQISGTVGLSRQATINQNPPVANLPMQRPADPKADTHDDYEAYQDIVPGGKPTLAIDPNGKKFYEVPFPDANSIVKIPVRPIGSSTLGTQVHVIRSGAGFEEGQHWIITPTGGWMGPMAR